MPLPLLALGASALISGISAGMGASKNAKARREEKANYNRQQGLLDYEQWKDPLTSVRNRSVFKQMDQRIADNTEAINNRAVAGGATVENVLAARQKNNETISNVGSQLLMAEDARRARVLGQRMALDDRHSQAVQQGYQADARNWQNWGAATSQAIMSYGMAGMLDGGASSGGSGQVFSGPLSSPANTDLTAAGNSMIGFGGSVPPITLGTTR